jgi:L-threonylcarbamoyladenylate synthase
MKIYKTFSREAAQTLKTGGVGVIPTDTLYGIVASAMNPEAVERLYKLRRRTPSKPSIILISSIADLKKFSVVLNAYSKKFLARYWPGKVSIVLPIVSADLRGRNADLRARLKPLKKFRYLHRGTNSLAFRVPGSAKLRAFLKKTGPLIAPSANIEGKPPAKTIVEAKEYFGDEADFYINAGRKDSKPSTLVKLLENKALVLRRGAVKIG